MERAGLVWSQRLGGYHHGRVVRLTCARGDRRSAGVVERVKGRKREKGKGERWRMGTA